ncbi:hypothetical protein ACRALDRAFT_206782 [Sodiomyces alcalophilus JCM 7366]|uniref:uncharacterized protein n=1 Tax=Sodiomyces alcalophilus JCM 7366 TaxID=591952 RepID=UPI0039B54A94
MKCGEGSKYKYLRTWVPTLHIRTSFGYKHTSLCEKETKRRMTTHFPEAKLSPVWSKESSPNQLCIEQEPNLVDPSVLAAQQKSGHRIVRGWKEATSASPHPHPFQKYVHTGSPSSR